MVYTFKALLTTARVMLLSILETFKVKFAELNRSFPRQKDEDAMDEDSEIGMREVAERRPIKTLAQSSENPDDPIKGACPWHNQN